MIGIFDGKSDAERVPNSYTDALRESVGARWHGTYKQSSAFVTSLPGVTCPLP
jgi:hypothetical protein